MSSQSADRLERIEAFKKATHVAAQWHYNYRDVILYALSVGCKRTELQYVFEKHPEFAALPTFAVIAVHKASLPYQSLLPNFDMVSTEHKKSLFCCSGNAAIGMRLATHVTKAALQQHAIAQLRTQYTEACCGAQRMLLHGEQFVELHAPLPVNGNFVVRPSLVDIQDKGKAALVITRASIVDPGSGRVYATNEVTAFVRGSGGFGRTKPVARTPAATATNKPPQRKPDAVIQEKTSPDLAALYRLNADYNPLHIDPEFSSKGGFKDPILHGLCSFGISAKHVLQQFGHGKPESLKNIKVSSVLFTSCYATYAQ